jgi:hypothetical protein
VSESWPKIGQVGSLDPNWFYSTLAQSTAAIVGLAGGFLAQRVLAQRGNIAAERLELRHALGQLHEDIEARRRVLPEIVLSMTEHLQAVADAREYGQSSVVLQLDVARTLTHSPAYSKDAAETQPIEIAEKHLTETRDAAKALLDALPATTEELIRATQDHGALDTKGHRWLRDPPRLPLDAIEPNNVWRWMHFQRDKAQELFREFDRKVEALAGQRAALEAKLLPTSLYVLFYIFGALLAAGVVVPLGFLSARPGDSKLVLTLVFGLLAWAFLIYLAYEVRALRRAGDLTRDF